jgi:NADH-quinone oxidoreductase subunit D
MGYASTIKIPFGPQHPALKEPENFIFEIDGDIVVNVVPRLGYVHRGVEKGFERRTYIQNLYLAERICGICSHAHTTCYVDAIEELLNVDPPPRAKHIRTIIAELERLHSHSLWVGIAAHEAGFDTLFMYTWRDREEVMDLLETISGNRVNYAMNTLGGVRRDIPNETFPAIKKHLDSFEKRMKEYLKIMKTEQTFIKRTSGVGTLKAEDALSTCAVGPNLRASGIKNDVRADDPYAAYAEIPFNIIAHDGGDVFCRAWVRGEEMLESINMIRYAMDHIPEGPTRIKVPMAVPPGEAVSRVEAPRGELLHYAKSNGTTKPERYKVRAPTLANIPSLVKTLIGAHLADVPLILAGIDPCFSCMDRMAFIDNEKNKTWVWSMEELKRHTKVERT